MSDVKYPRLGELIDYLVQVLRAVKKWSMGQTMAFLARSTHFSVDTIYDWRQGVRSPSEESIEILIQIGKEDADLDRSWGESLLKAAKYSNIDKLINEIWGAQELRYISHNLPRLEHTVFVGRQAETKRLLELLSPIHAAPLISIDGIGGVGKTTLALEVAYRCLRVSQGREINPSVPTFEAVIFVSAKQKSLTAYGTLRRQQTHRTLRDIYHEIAHTLDRPEITRTTPEAQLGLVYRVLAKQRTLLIVDNLETMLDQQEIVAFLYDLPRSVKAVITTRERAIFAPIRLSQLPEPEGLVLIQHEAKSKMVILEQEETRQLYQHTGGVPAAIIFVIGQLSVGYSVTGVLEQLKAHEGDIAQFCFEGSIAPLRGKAAHHLFMAVAMFPKRPLREAVIHVAGLSTDLLDAEEGLARLQQLSLISAQKGRYQMLPLTREYGLTELAIHHEFEEDARKRWVQWYLDFAEKNGGPDWEEWHLKYDHLEQEWENFSAVFNWCIATDHFSAMEKFWSEYGLIDFANIYGRWDDQLIWLDWLSQAAERRGEWSIAVRAMSDKAWPLIIMGQPSQLQEAQRLLTKAWQYKEFSDPKHLASVTNHIVTLHIRQGDYSEAFYWTDLQENFIKQADFINNKQKNRCRIIFLYHKAEVFYKIGNLIEAEELYYEVVKCGQSINWQRAIIYAQNCLADVAIARDDFAKADSLLKVGLPIVKRNKDKRRIAFFERSYALMKHKCSDLLEAHAWAEKALDGFDRLGMQPEAEEMRNLLEKLNQLEG